MIDKLDFNKIKNLNSSKIITEKYIGKSPLGLFARSTHSTQNTVLLTAMIYYNKRYKAKSTKGKETCKILLETRSRHPRNFS